MCEGTPRTASLPPILHITDARKYCVPCNTSLTCPHDDTPGSAVELSGVHVVRGFITPQEEDDLIREIKGGEWAPSQSGRVKQDFGPRANYKRKKLKLGSFAGLPASTSFLRERLVNMIPVLATFQPVEQCNLLYHPERGSHIDFHFDDSWLWGERLVIINLASDTMFSFLYPASRRCLHVTRWLYYNRNLLPRELNAIKSDCNLVDVRQPEELVHEMPAIPGAVNVPLGELEGRIGELPKENVVFICRGGNTSLSCPHDDTPGSAVELCGVQVVRGFITPQEEEDLIRVIKGGEWAPSQSGRVKQDFGPKANYKRKKLKLGSFAGLPASTSFLRERLVNTIPVLATFQPVEQCNLLYHPERGSHIDFHFDDSWLWAMFSFLYPASRRCLHVTRWLYYNRNLLPRELNAIKSDCNLVDVRQPEELVHEMPAIPGAVNVPLGELEGRIGELPKDNVVFICRGGVRSERALGIAEQAGFTEPRHLDGESELVRLKGTDGSWVYCAQLLEYSSSQYSVWWALTALEVRRYNTRARNHTIASTPTPRTFPFGSSVFRTVRRSIS
eukprot:sb/3463534/